MADALVCLVLEKLTTLIIDEVNQQVKLVVGVDKELEKLQSNLRAIHDVLADTEEKQLKENAVKEWLDQLKDVAYDMEDVLDEWNTARLKLQIEGEDCHDSASKATNGRTMLSLCSCSCFSWMLSLFSCSCFSCKEVGFKHDIAREIKKLNEKLNNIMIQKDTFGFKVGKGKAQQSEPQTTTSFIDTTEVQSGKVEKEMIKNVSLSEGSESSTMKIISIAGIGGIGKTILAQLLFNDDDVKAHFNQNIWVCVSKAILESLSGNAQRFSELQAIMTRIKEVVTRDISHKWQQPKHSLSGGLPGSKSLVTTRSESVVRTMGCTSNYLFHVKKLSSDECWSIFWQIAFFNRDNEECKLLEPIGREIVNKCDGLPLYVKVLESILRLKGSLQEWEDVLSNEPWELPGICKGQIGLALLWLTYYDLPLEMRQCFLYSVIFPEDHNIKLIAMRMAQGYLGTTSRIKNATEICGEENFQSLSRHCFFQFDDTCQCYKIHDILLDFAQYLKGEESFSVEINNSEELTELPTLPTRHLRIEFGEEASLPSTICKLEKLRTFWLQSNGKGVTEATLSSLFDKLICLRSLFQSECGIREIPASIGKLIHLRQLDLYYNLGLRKLHENVCELYNLQTLDVSDCRDLNLPRRMKKLISLRHLDNSWCTSLNPEGLSRLSKLRRIMDLVIDSGTKEGNYGIEDLQNFKNLEGALRIRNLGNVKEAQFNKINQIIDLRLDFGDSAEREEERHHEQVIEALWPSLNVKTLYIEESKRIKSFPNWLMLLNNLKVLKSKCKTCEHLPPLRKLPTLEKLGWSYMKGVKRLGGRFAGMESGMNVGDEVSKSSSMVAPMGLIWPLCLVLAMYALS